MTVKEIYCNLCGKRFNFWDEQENYSIHTTCGYGSKNDGETLRLDICCSCMDKLIDGCVIRPIETEIDDGSVKEMFDEN